MIVPPSYDTIYEDRGPVVPEPILLPKLEQLHFSTDLTFRPETITEIVVSRWNAKAHVVGRLSKVELYLWTGSNRETEADLRAFDRLEPLKAQGLEFEANWR
jgi:hypothetical protein